jgi:hypothetical protein
MSNTFNGRPLEERGAAREGQVEGGPSSPG